MIDSSGRSPSVCCTSQLEMASHDEDRTLTTHEAESKSGRVARQAGPSSTRQVWEGARAERTKTASRCAPLSRIGTVWPVLARGPCQSWKVWFFRPLSLRRRESTPGIRVHPRSPLAGFTTAWRSR
jgi:hypothetical protein